MNQEVTHEESRPERNRTFGISLPPALKGRGEARAGALGLSFSRYVALCVEAELNGHVASLVAEEGPDLERAVERARSYLEQKARSVEFEEDVAARLHEEGVSFARLARVGEMRVDFLVTTSDGRHVAVECRSNARTQRQLLLGQAILLSVQPGIDGVVVVVPYLRAIEPEMKALLEERGIRLATVDGLVIK